MEKINNPRFPHTCKIYYMEESSPFSEGEEVVVYEGVCRKYINMHPYTTKVISSSYGASLPGIVEGIMPGYFMDVADRSGEFKKCTIKDCNAGNLGTSVFFDAISQ